MFASSRDDECEQYLRLVLQNGAGGGSGEMPSAYPSKYFEVSWVSGQFAGIESKLTELQVLTTLLDNRYSASDLGIEDTDSLGEMLRDALVKGGGIVGFGTIPQHGSITLPHFSNHSVV